MMKVQEYPSTGILGMGSEKRRIVRRDRGFHKSRNSVTIDIAETLFHFFTVLLGKYKRNKHQDKQDHH
jgi:hypothetical protein